MTNKTKVKIGLVTAGGISLCLGLPGLVEVTLLAGKVVAPMAAAVTLAGGSLWTAYLTGKHRAKKLYSKG